MPDPYPREFRQDVVRVARNRGPNVLVKDIAADFGISESCLNNWMRKADVKDGNKPGTTTAEQTELREARRRIRPESVKPDETTSHSFWMSASREGSLIQATDGSRGGWGRRWRNRPGLAA